MKYTIWINVVIGFWLVIAAFTQHSELLRGVRMVNDLAVGVLLLCCALWYLMERGAATAVNLFLGAWLIASPFIMSYEATNDVLCGIAVVVVALVEGRPALLRRPLDDY
jgi:hypothetical protein